MRELRSDAPTGVAHDMAAEAGETRAQQRLHLRAVEGGERYAHDTRHLRDGAARCREQPCRENDAWPNARAGQRARPTVARAPGVPIFASFRSKNSSTAAFTDTAFAHSIM